MSNFYKFFLIILVSSGFLYASNETSSFDIDGLKVILKKNTANDIISAQLYIRGGALNLTEQTQGIEPLIFNSALKGTKKYPKDELNTILDRTAANINGSASRDYSSVSLRTVKQFFDLTWDVYTDVIMNPAFETSEVELVREQLLSTIKQRKDGPDSYLGDLADELFYRDHPYKLDPQGTEESVRSITIDQMRQYLKKNLQKSQLLLVVVGNVSKEELKKKIESSFGNLPQGDYKAVYPQFVNHDKPFLNKEQRDLPTNYIMGFMSAPDLKDGDYYPMTITMSILGTRIWEEVRTKRNLSYAPQAFFSNSFANRAGIYVTAVNPDTTIKVMLAEINKIKTEPVSEKDLKDRTTMYLTRYYLGNETNAAQGQFLARYELAGLGWQASEDYVSNLRKVSVADVQRVAKKYLNNIQFVVLGNPDLIDQKVFTSL